MRHKQRFFPEPGYVPQVYGYGRVSHKGQMDQGNSLVDQEARIKAYYELRKLEPNSPFTNSQWGGMFAEPRAQSAYSRAFNVRPTGRELVERLQPSDILIIDKIDRLFRSLEDFVLQMRWFNERGIGLHIVNFHGISVDTNSSAGDMILKIFAVFAEAESVRISERVTAARAGLRSRKKHGGTTPPFFCEVVGQEPGKALGCGGHLVFKPWALPLMKQVDELSRAGVTFYQMSHHTLKKETDRMCSLASDYKKRGKRLKFLRDFYRAWVEAGQPNINELKVLEFVKIYRHKHKEEGK